VNISVVIFLDVRRFG